MCISTWGRGVIDAIAVTSAYLISAYSDVWLFPHKWHRYVVTVLRFHILSPVLCVLPLELTTFDKLWGCHHNNSATDNTFPVRVRPAPWGHHFSCCAIISGRFGQHVHQRSDSFLCHCSVYASSGRACGLVFCFSDPSSNMKIYDSQRAWLTLLLNKWGSEASPCSVVGSVHSLKPSFIKLKWDVIPLNSPCFIVKWLH